MPLVNSKDVAKWEDLRNLYDRTNSERNRWEYSVVDAPVKAGQYLVHNQDLLQIRNLIDEMTGNSFLAEIASTEDVRNIASKSYLGHLENNQLSDILTDIEATIIYEDTCTTVVARYDSVCQTHKMNNCFTCPYTAKSSHYGSHDSCPSHCGSHQTCSYNGTVCTSGFSNSSCPVTYTTQKGAHNPSCSSHQSCNTGFNFDGARAAAASIMTLSLDLENAVIDDTDGGLGGLNFSTSLMQARAVSCPPYCEIYTDGALSYKAGYNSNHCVAGFCGSFNAADYFNTL